MSVTGIGANTDGSAAGAVDPLPLLDRTAVVELATRRALPGALRDATLQRALLASDGCAIVVASLVIQLLQGSAGDPLWAFSYLGACLILLRLHGLYAGRSRRLGHSTLDDAGGAFHAALLAVAVTCWASAMSSEPAVGAAYVPVLLGVTVALVLAGRAAVRSIAPRLLPPESVVVVGGGAGATRLLRKLGAVASGRLEARGYLCDPETLGTELDGLLPCLGRPEDLADVCRSHSVDRVMIVSEELEPGRLDDVLREASRAGARVTLLPAAADALGPATTVDELEGLTVLAVDPVRLSRSSRTVKRCLDVALSSLSLIVLAPFVPLVALAIKLDSQGPVLFRQKRVGRGGRVFELVKFRTMVQDAEARVQELQALSADVAWLRLDHDPRVTRIGRVLRLTSIDELPQLWNVLRGEMSLVGPRPMPLITGSHISGWAARRHDLMPGITGMWQVLGRASLSFEEMVKLDYVYVTNWSVWRDVRLLLRTIPVVLSRRGAN